LQAAFPREFASVSAESIDPAKPLDFFRTKLDIPGPYQTQIGGDHFQLPAWGIRLYE